MAALDRQAEGRAPDILELHVIEGPAKGQALPKPARCQTTLTVGRTKASKMHIKGDPAVSERHAVIAWAPDGWTLADVGSSNGTLVNGERLEADGPAKQLKDGDIVQFGTDTKVRVELAPHADEDITVEQYFEAECHRLIQRIRGRYEQHANQLRSEWQAERRQLEALVA